MIRAVIAKITYLHIDGGNIAYDIALTIDDGQGAQSLIVHELESLNERLLATGI